VLLSTADQLRESGKESFDSHSTHFHELPRYQSCSKRESELKHHLSVSTFSILGDDGRSQDNHCSISKMQTVRLLILLLCLALVRAQLSKPIARDDAVDIENNEFLQRAVHLDLISNWSAIASILSTPLALSAGTTVRKTTPLPNSARSTSISGRTEGFK